MVEQNVHAFIQLGFRTENKFYSRFYYEIKSNEENEEWTNVSTNTK